jgi:hypothetical protein
MTPTNSSCRPSRQHSPAPPPGPTFKITKPIKLKQPNALPRLTALYDTPPPAVTDSGYGVGRAPGDDTEPFPALIDPTANKPSTRKRKRAAETEYHCMMHCPHSICRTMRERFLVGTIHHSAREIVFECSGAERCWGILMARERERERAFKRKRFGLRTLKGHGELLEEF